MAHIGKGISRPNILIVMTDHQRADSALPGNGMLVPNLAKFAKEGISFSNSYCPTAHCCPSRATFFSGLYPSGHGVWNNVGNAQAINRGLKKDVRLWSEDLRDAGYDLHFSGKWHVSAEESPSARGWQEHFASATGSGDEAKLWEMYRCIAKEGENHQRGNGEILRPGYGTYKLYGTLPGIDRESHDEKVLAETLDFLGRTDSRSNPWCFFTGFIGPHDPYMVPAEYVDRYDIKDIRLPDNYSDDLMDKPYVYRRMKETRFGQLSEREVKEGILHFKAYCSYLDDMFGRIMASLKRTGQEENTLVVFTSDHGDYCGEHGLFAKGVPSFLGAYHIPVIARWPSIIRNPGSSTDEFVSHADFAPTFLEAAGIRTDRHFTGMSLLPFMSGESPKYWRSEIHTQFNGTEVYYTQRSVMTKDFKYVYNAFDRDELYDRAKDPGEIRNLSGNPAYDDVKKDMCRRIWKFAYEEGDTAINPYIIAGLAPYGPAEIFK